MSLIVVFPGIGYGIDKPLLYYSKKIAKNHNFDIVDVIYSGFPANVRGDKAKMKECIEIAYEQAKSTLEKVDFSNYPDIIFVGKSVGTVVAGMYAQNYQIDCKFVLYTPVEETFEYVRANAICFHGTNDPWVETSVVKAKCDEYRIPLYITENANHSLEVIDTLRNIEIVKSTMETFEKQMFK